MRLIPCVMIGYVAAAAVFCAGCSGQKFPSKTSVQLSDSGFAYTLRIDGTAFGPGDAIAMHIDCESSIAIKSEELPVLIHVELKKEGSKFFSRSFKPIWTDNGNSRHSSVPTLFPSPNDESNDRIGRPFPQGDYDIQVTCEFADRRLLTFDLLSIVIFRRPPE
jgi:hypothetical protein